jgi:hypothetical protein
MAAIVVLPLILSPIGFGNLTETVTRMARWPVLLIVLLLGLAILYRHGPDRRAARWQWVSIGSVLGAELNAEIEHQTARNRAKRAIGSIVIGKVGQVPRRTETKRQTKSALQTPRFGDRGGEAARRTWCGHGRYRRSKASVTIEDKNQPLRFVNGLAKSGAVVRSTARRRSISTTKS